MRDFLADPDPHKRAKLIDGLLETARHAGHLAAVWRAALAPEVVTVPEARAFQKGFERWVRALSAAPLSPDPDAASGEP